MTTIGSASRFALEYLRRYPQHIREVVLDSPGSPQVDPLTAGVRGTPDAIGELFEVCKDVHDCERAHPDIEDSDPVVVENHDAHR